jgi:uncharacterized protein YdhG (YjbR/CyaY superfamily)
MRQSKFEFERLRSPVAKTNFKSVDEYIASKPEAMHAVLARVRGAIRAALVAAFKDELAPYKISKGTIRFPLSQPVPVELIGPIARFRMKEGLRAKEIAGRGQGKAIKTL